MPAPLPPLPATIRGARVRWRPGGREVDALMAAAHREIAAWCARLADPTTPAARRRVIAEAVVAEVSRHLCAEEQYVYPAVRAAGDAGPGNAGAGDTGAGNARDAGAGDAPGGPVPAGSLVERELAEDDAVRRTLRELVATAPGGAEFDRLAESLAVQFRRHAEAGECEVLPRLRAVASRAERIRLGNRAEVAGEAAPTRPHRGPVTPPWNRVVDPAFGVLDKLRDAVTGRTTYARDL